MEKQFLTYSATLLRELVNEHPDSYVKVGDKYVPMLMKLFNLQHIRDKKNIIDSGRYKIEEHKDLPVIFVCDHDEDYAFNYLYDQMTYGPNYKSLDDDKIDNYIKLVARLANTKELKNLLSGIKKTNTFYLSLLKYQIQLRELFTFEERKIICCDLYKYVCNEYVILVPKIFIKHRIERNCRYGSRCKLLKSFKCKYTHPNVVNYKFTKGAAATINESMEMVRNIYRAYGFIYIATRKEYNILTETIPSYKSSNYEFRFYRPSTGKIHEIIDYSWNVNYTHSPLMIKDEGKDYDYESECKKTLKDYSTVHKMCRYWSDWQVIIDGNLETLYLVKIFVPYRCGYKCNTIFDHGHGN